jgi:hypothetical protein
VSTRTYTAVISFVLVVLFGGLLATDNVLFGVDRLFQSYPYRAYPPISEMSPFLESWGLGDSVLHSYPALTYVHRSLQSGALPLWNPLEGLGMPVAAAHGLGYMFPVHWLTYGLLTPLLAWHVELMAILALSSLSAFALFKRVTGCYEGAALGATAWTFGGWIGAYLQLPSYAWTLALFPWVLLGIERVAQRRPFAHLQVGVGLAFILTVGHLQMVLPALGATALWALWRARAALAGLALALGTGVAMASYHLVPLAELLKLSERERIPLELVLKALLLPREFLGMVFPTLMGQPSDNFYFGAMLASPVINGREHCAFAGVLTLLLAVLAAWRRHDPASRPIAGLALGGLVLAGAPWLYGPLCRAAPPLLFLTPTRFLPFILFAMCLLAAQGWVSLRANPLKKQETRALLAVLGAFCVGALSFILPASTYSVGFQAWLMEMAKVNFAVKPMFFEGDFGPVFVSRVLNHFSFGSPAIAVSFLVVIASAVLVHSHIGKVLPFRPVFLVLCLDLGMFFALMNPGLPESGYFPQNPDVEHLAQRATLSGSPEPPLRVLSLGHGAYPNLFLVEGIANLEAYESAHPADTRKVFDALNRGFVMGHQDAVFVGDLRVEDGALDLLGLGALYNPPEKWDASYGAPTYKGAIWALDRQTPLRAFLVDRYRLSDRAQAMTSLMQPGFDPRAEVLLEQGPGYPSPATASFEAVSPLEYSPHRIAFKVNPSQPTMLVVNDLHYPGWRATVNGQDRPIQKAYGFARAVELPAGASEVVLEFSPTGFPYTPWLAVISFCLLFGFSLGQWRSQKTSSSSNRFVSKPGQKPDYPGPWQPL